MLSDEDFSKLLLFFDRPWAGYRKVRKGVKKRVRRHMERLGCSSIETYLDIIRLREDQREQCEQALLVTISRFFRDRRLWQILAERELPRLVDTFGRHLEIWSAGCANGEEAYSAAIICRRMAMAPDIGILATDVSSQSLSRARQGAYNRSSLKEVPDDVRDTFFKPHGRRQMLIRYEKLPAIDWREHNLLDSPPDGPFHIIFLRNNLLTYHQGTELKNAFDKITAILVPQGILVTGSHEKLPQTDVAFTRNTDCPHIYQAG